MSKIYTQTHLTSCRFRIDNRVGSAFLSSRLNCLSALSENVHLIIVNLIKDNIALLELTFEYNVWYQTNRNIEKYQITYYTDEDEQ